MSPAPRKIQRYGWRRDAIDRRDVLFRPAIAHIPEVFDLRAHCPPPMDQEDLGSCVAHGTTGGMRFALIKQGNGDLVLARRQLYYDVRVIEGTVKVDAGGEIRDAIKTAAGVGVANENFCPYDISKFAVQPTHAAYQDAHKRKVLEYRRVGSQDGTATAAEIKAAIASGFPVVGGFNVFKQFESEKCARDGIVMMPEASEEPIGGHCVYFVAYGQKSGMITARNSYGGAWGDKGDFYVPEPFLEQQGSDFWVITKVAA